MKWPKVETLNVASILEPGYSVKDLTEADVATLAGKVKAWYPDIQVGAESCHLREDFYREHCLPAEGSQKVYAVLVMKETSIVGLLTLEKNDDARSVYARMGVVDPTSRGAGLAYLGPKILESVAVTMGAELTYYFATLKHQYQQRVAEKLGFRLVGIVPGHDRDMISAGVSKRVFEALYCKPLVDASELQLPENAAMTDKTKALYRFLFEQ